MKDEKTRQHFFQWAGFLVGATGVAVTLYGFTRKPPPAPPPPRRILEPGHIAYLVGDSIGVGIDRPLQERLHLYGSRLDADVKEGTTASYWAPRIAEHDSGFDVILLSLGTNEAAGNPLAHFDALNQLVTTLRSRGAPVYWVRPPSFRREGLTKRQQQFAGMMEELGVPELDVRGPQPDTSMDPMHIHLTPDGYDQYAAQIFDALTRPE